MRNYRQYCGIAKALDVVGGRWSLLIARELLPGPRRYSELQTNLVGITPNLLAERLKTLETEGVVEAVPSLDGSGRHAWALTQWGRTLEPALLGLGAFGARRMTNPVGHRTSGRWFVVSLQRRYRGGLTPGAIALVIDGEPYTLLIDKHGLTARDGLPNDPALTLSGPLRAIAGTLGRSAAAAGSITVEGNGALVADLRAALD